MNLTVPGQGPYKYWTDAKLPTAPPDTGPLIETNPTAITLPAEGYLAVYDTTTGNMAVKPVKGLKGSLTLTDADFSLVNEFKVAVRHDGRAVQAANVTVIDGARSQSAILDSGMNGVVTFYGVKQGHIEVKVEYASNGKQAEPLDLVKELQHTRTDKDCHLQRNDRRRCCHRVTRPSAGGSGQGSTGDNLGPSTQKPPQTVGTMVGKTFTIVIGLAIAVAIAAAAIWAFRAHPKAISERLTALGVQIPKDPNEAMDAGPVIPAAPVKPEPPQKIMLEDSAPTPLAAAPISTPVPLSPAGPPSRLTAESGGSVDLPDGTTLIGREATLGLVLPDPSTLSRRHAELVRQGGHLLVRDLGSTNGTYVNGRKIDSDTPLQAGDAVQFGAVRFKVEA